MTAREGNLLRQLGRANDKQCIHSSYTITQKRLQKTQAGMQHNRCQLICLTCLLFRQLPLPPEPDPTLLAVCTTVHMYARSILP